jgi:hypothetical protein
MTKLLTSLILAAAMLAPAARASATPDVERVQPLLLGDVVVNGTTQPAPAPAQPAPVVVQPQTQSPPVVAPPARQTQTTVVEHEQHNYMTTVAVSALMGGLAGALVGGSLYYLADDQKHPARIGYWAAGGVLVGGAVGVTQVLVQESRVDRATASRLPTDPAPTFRLALARVRF